MRLAVITCLIICLLSFPALALDGVASVDYDVASDSFYGRLNVGQNLEELRIGGIVGQSLSNLDLEAFKLDELWLYAELKIDENLTIKAKRDCTDLFKGDLLDLVITAEYSFKL